jgi:hypothetical protein
MSRLEQNVMANEKPKAQVSGPAAAIVICVVVLICAGLYLWKTSQPPGFVSVPQEARTQPETPAQLKENDAFLRKLAALPVNRRAGYLALHPDAGHQIAFSPDPSQKKKLQGLIPLGP